MATSYPEYKAYNPYDEPPYPTSNATASRSAYPPHGTAYDTSNPSRAGDRGRDVQAYKKTQYRKDDNVAVDMREVSRTPSPTPSEAKELEKAGVFDWNEMANWRFWFRKEWTLYYIIGTVITVIVILFTVYHAQIVKFVQPAANWMHGLTGGWAIPIAILFVLSFPPLFGHEIVAIVCGLVWGLWVGFAIVAAGTFLGEVGNFYAFKYCCAARSEKLERTKLSYACLARVVREGGFKIALIARLSAIPGHFTTAVFSTCGMSIWTFSIAAVLSLPKQFLTVYLGVALEQSETHSGSKTDTIIKYVVIGITTVITIVAMWYIYHKMNLVKGDVIYARRKARQGKLSKAGASPYGNSSVTDSTVSVSFDSGFNPGNSESHIPLTSAQGPTPYHQQWDSSGRAVGYGADPSLHAPSPRRAAAAPRSSEDVMQPAMSQRERYAPVRQSTDGSGGSVASWDMAAGGDDSYMMKRTVSPPHDPFQGSSDVPSQPYRHPASPTPRVAPPTTSAHFTSTSAQPTPTQTQFAYTTPYASDGGYTAPPSLATYTAPHSRIPKILAAGIAYDNASSRPPSYETMPPR